VTVPLSPFAAELYLRELRDRTAGAPPGSARELAWLWACAALDVRCDSILIPILVLPEDLPLAETLERRNGERGWGLPPDYFRERLERGGCLLVLDGGARIADQYPRCRIV